MKRKNKIKILSYILASTLLLSGCKEKSECDIPTRHVHRYIKEVTEDISIETYFDDEHLTKDGYNWTNNYLEINKQDEKIYKLLAKNELFDGKTNWNYLFNKMANNHDYLEFYYSYVTIQTYYTTDSKVNLSMHTMPVVKSGWTYNPNYSHNTGLTRLCHHRYFGYQVAYNNGKYEIIKSEPVDDIRYIIDDYPYYSESCTKVVTEEFEFNEEELKNLSPDDFNVFEGPNLTTKDIHIKKRTN